jgi:hypothetical protein
MLFAGSCRKDRFGDDRGIPWVPVAKDARIGERQNLGRLEHDPIDEASGMAASRQNPGVIWTLNDSGGGPKVYALDLKGRHLGAYKVLDARNRDWEDMAIGPGPEEGRHYLYIADIGDNNAKHEVKTVYRVPEPVVRANQSPQKSALGGAEALRFRYPDGKRDAETLMIDPRTKDLYIISKREDRVLCYRAAYPQSTSEVTSMELLGPLMLYNVTAGDISPSGGEILLKAYSTIKYWRVAEGATIWETLQGESKRLPYEVEPQGESIAWAADESGYFTVSEERDGIPAYLYFYPRLTDSD